MNLFTPAKVLAFCLLLSVGFVSCQSGQTTSTDTTSVAQNGPIPVIYLDTLAVPAKIFMDNKNKNFIFEYFFGDSTVTLNGWITQKAKVDSVDYSLIPNVKLLPRGKTKVSLGPNTYVSNQLLSKETVKKIVDRIKADKRNANLLFVPVRPMNTNRIYYKVFIEFINKDVPDVGSVIDDGFSTNPSPPHGYGFN